ncbi:MAG: hypothetical protein ACRES3_02420 [Steroidobacteraceae bacterium]
MRQFVAGLCLLATAAAANPTTGLDNQARAQRVLALAMQVVGGETTLRALRSMRREYLENWVDVGQGQRPWTGTPAAADLPPHSGFDDSVGLSFLDYAGNRYYESIRYADAPNDYAVVVEAGSPALSFETITYVHERPFFAERPAGERDAERLRRFRRYPEGLLRMALDRIETLLWIGQIEEDGSQFDSIAFADTSGTQTRLYFDAANHRLIRSETLRGHGVYGDTTNDTVYSDFRRIGRFELPHTIVNRVAGVPTSRLHVASTAIDAAAQEDWFKPPADSVAIAPTPAEPVVKALGGGVHLIRGAYNLIFAEFQDHVLLVEAPISEPYARACLDLIEATVPGKPIRLVSTHFHFDHVGGVHTAIARGTPILTTADARDVIDRSLASTQAMRPDELARQSRVPVIEIAGKETVLDDGSQRVELYDFGPTPHVAQILVAYFPRQKLLHVADIFDVLTPELVIAGVDTVVMAQRIQEFGLNVDQIVPMHGVPVTIDHLRRGLEIRRKYTEGSP